MSKDHQQQPQYVPVYVGFAKQIRLGNQYVESWSATDAAQCKLEGNFVIFTTGKRRVRVHVNNTTYIAEQEVSGE